MNSFDSETQSSDSSCAPIIHKKVQMRKMRRTEDLISLNVSEDIQENVEPTDKIKKNNISFLPKIEVIEAPEKLVLPKTKKVKKDRPSLTKNIAVFKIGRSMIEVKQFQSNKKPTLSKSKFPKINLKLNTKPKPKKPKENNTSKSKKSDASNVAKNLFGSIIKDAMKRKSKSLSRKSQEVKKKETLHVVLKDLYVNLIPLERTNLVNTEQMMQLSNNNNKHSSLDKPSADRKKKSLNRKSSFSLKNIVPCKVIVDRLTLEQINLIISSKGSDILPDLSTENRSYLNVAESHNQTASFEQNISGVLTKRRTIPSQSKEMSRMSSNSIGNVESFFNPPGSSSPLNSSTNLIISNETHLEDESGKNKSKLTSLKYLNDDEELENKNATFDVLAGASSRRSSLNRKGFLELPQLHESIQEEATTSSTSKRQRKSRRFSTVNETYDFNKPNSDTSKEKLTDSSDRDATFNKSSELTSVSTKSDYVFTENGKRRFSCDSEIDVSKKRKSNSCNSTDLFDKNSAENTQLLDKQEKKAAGSIPRTRRSTLTLEDSVNDVTLLKSMCDASGTPRKLNKSEKAKPQTLIKQALKKMSMSNGLDNNITIRKPCSESIGELSKIKKLNRSNIDSTSPPWDSATSSCSFEEGINEIDDCVIGDSPYKNTSKSIGNDGSDSSEQEEEEIEESSTSSTSTDYYSVNRTTGSSEIIEVSDEESEKEESSSASSDSESEEETHLQKQTRRVTFEIDMDKKIKLNQPKVSIVRLSSPKSMLKNNTNKVSFEKHRRVTFNNMSVVIIDDNITFDSSSQRKSNVDFVPTNFPSESDDEASNELPEFNKRGTVGRTPMTRRLPSSKFSKENSSDQTQACFQSPRFSSKKVVDKTPIHVNSPRFNKRGAVGRTPLRLKTPLEDNVQTKLNDRISSGERVRLQNDSPITITKTASTSKMTKMPNFASMHKQMFDKMLNLQEYSKHKEERAKLLLSGQKPIQSGSALKKSASKQPENNSHKKILFRKQLKYDEASTSQIVPNKLEVRKKAAVLVSSTPKGKKNEKNGFTRYGFKVAEDRSLTKKEQLMAVGNKTKIPKSSTAGNRTEIRGVRSNRRFDLLMKMRNKQQK